MTLLELVKYLRESILDDTGGTSVVWQEITESDAEMAQLRWTNEELTLNLTQAEREIARRAKLLKDRSGDYDITTVVDQSSYSLDPKVLRVISARIDKRALVDHEIEELDQVPNWEDRKGKPTVILSDVSNRSVDLWPIPDAVYTVNTVVYRLPKVDLDWNQADTQSPEIPEFHHFGMINYAAYLCYLKDEANAMDPTRAGTFKALFDADYPDQSRAAEMRKMRNRNRTIKYGGIR